MSSVGQSLWLQLGRNLTALTGILRNLSSLLILFAPRLGSNGKEEVLGLLVGKAADKGGQIKTGSQWLVDSGGQPGSPETGSDPGYGSDEEAESQVT